MSCKSEGAMLDWSGRLPWLYDEHRAKPSKLPTERTEHWGESTAMCMCNIWAHGSKKPGYTIWINRDQPSWLSKVCVEVSSAFTLKHLPQGGNRTLHL